MKREKTTPRQKENKWEGIVGILITILLLPIAAIVYAYFILSKILLTVLAWSVWCSRGKYILFVWSDSPIWKDYIVREFLPKIEHRTVMLNWSQRNQWNRWALSVNILGFFGGNRQFNPMAIVFRPFRRTQVFRFWKPFKDYQRGDKAPLEDISKDFLEYVE
jgi:hypothetical protein